MPRPTRLCSPSSVARPELSTSPNPIPTSRRRRRSRRWVGTRTFVQILQIAQRTDELLVAPPPAHRLLVDFLPYLPEAGGQRGTRRRVKIHAAVVPSAPVNAKILTEPS